ncbi:MAG: AmmeMemoRadiSam system protein B [Desulfovibrionaceae bacterium]|nr:AmmeMemoRadiSam system protein B [Desulfovibrionaceae bacterium]
MNAQTVIREPVAIGRFYPQNRDQLEECIPAYFQAGLELLAETKQPTPTTPPWAILLPHAGYVYCGKVIGATLGKIKLPETLIILCPNHTGRGQPFSVWPDGFWKMPFGNFPIATDIVKLITQNQLFVPDYLSHLNEHSIEVLLSFLFYSCGQKLPAIVPISIGTHNQQALQAAGLEMARVLKKLESENRQVGLIISSDMNHYEDHETCMAKDNLALEKIINNDPDGLLQVCSEKNITMCGVAPTALMLYAAKYLLPLKPKVIYHTSSAEASGNFRQTVGYAGLHFASN